MKLLKRVTDSDFYGGVPEYLSYITRYGSRGILIDDNFNIALMFLSKMDLYKLPGGGIEQGETKEQAFLREILEETGYNAIVIDELGYIEEHKNRNIFMQYSYCFIAKVYGDRRETYLSGNEIELGMELRWMTIKQALALMVKSLDKCEDYKAKFMILRDKIILETGVLKIQQYYKEHIQI
jgi:ADP-ribose pyrophosphatase YjhB (NUDIX family)